MAAHVAAPLAWTNPGGVPECPGLPSWSCAVCFQTWGNPPGTYGKPHQGGGFGCLPSGYLGIGLSTTPTPRPGGWGRLAPAVAQPQARAFQAAPEGSTVDRPLRLKKAGRRRAAAAPPPSAGEPKGKGKRTGAVGPRQAVEEHVAPILQRALDERQDGLEEAQHPCGGETAKHTMADSEFWPAVGCGQQRLANLYRPTYSWTWTTVSPSLWLGDL